ncbi:aldehyde dehydrogenase family protein [Streptomyces sp. NPDC096080]|uniref:aldehyde dehydrogenase family protein n=1 Tax=Streptomyces sp. NPDC096080 TaxID=3156693 RepID=UPI003332CAF7
MIISYSPQCPEQQVATASQASAHDVAEAADHARRAQRSWAGTPAEQRASVLSSVADAVATASAELTDLVVTEVGKPCAEAAGEVQRTIALLRYYAQQALDPVGSVHEPTGPGLLYTRRRPLGLAGLITPWNFPLAIPVWKLAPALAFGNAALLKPAPQAIGCAMRMSELFAARLPDPALLQLLPGGAATGSAVVEHADAVSFTGSDAVGRTVVRNAATAGRRVQAEMGGQNPAIVLPDTDPIAVASMITGAALTFAGQKCTATRRVIAVGDPRELRDALIAAVTELPWGDPADPATVAGPVIDARACDIMSRAIDEARHAGGRILVGGHRAESDGHFFSPTLVDGLPPEHPLTRREVFGPLLLLQHAASLDEAMTLANQTPFGLVASIHTNDLSAALEAADHLEAGQIRVNAPTTGAAVHTPFGGMKGSSYGEREQGKAAQHFYTSVHTVAVRGLRAPGTAQQRMLSSERDHDT